VDRFYPTDIMNKLDRIHWFADWCQRETGRPVEFGVDDQSRYFMVMPDDDWRAIAVLLFF
jgi:hypothetical protein